MNKQRTRKQAGQVVVIVGLLLIALDGILALVLDGGNLYLQRRRVQNAVDAAALATAYRVAAQAGDATVSATLVEYAVTRNGADAASAVYLPSNARVGGGLYRGIIFCAQGPNIV